MARVSKSDRDEAIARLREWIKPGDTVYTVLDHVSRSGMMRHIRVVVPTVRFCCGTCGQDAATDTARGERVSKQLADPCWREDCGGRIVTQVDHIHPNYAVGKALGLSHAKRNGREQDALLVGGCGMDMGFHLVYELSYVLFRDGFDCIGRGCPSNDHSNGDRDYTIGKRHSDPGYALRHRWL